MSFTIATIPENITLFYTQKSKLTISSQVSNTNFGTVDGCITVPSDASDKIQLTNAKTYLSSFILSSASVYQKTVKNEPISNIRIISSSVSSYGTMFKVLIDEHCVVLREDVLFESILNTGISVGGILPGQYIWASYYKKLILVRIDSQLHQGIFKYLARKQLPVIKNLEVGGVYANYQNKKVIFLGKVHSINYSVEAMKHSFNFKEIKLRNAGLFFDYHDSPNLNLTEFKEYKLRKSHTYAEKIGQISIPNNIIEIIRDLAIESAKQKIVSFSKGEIRHFILSSFIVELSSFTNMHQIKEKPVELFNAKKLLAFC